MILHQVEQVKITILMDNYTDILLSDTENVQRPPIINRNSDGLLTPIAEHGFSAMVEIIYREGDDDSNNIKTKKFLFDAGVSRTGVLSNINSLGIDLKGINAIILSHGHIDHYSGLFDILEHMSKPVPFYTQPDAFLKRWMILPSGSKVFTVLDEEKLKSHGAIVHKNSNVTFLPEGDDNPRLLITGEIPRVTEFEKGFPFQYREADKSGELVHDPMIRDDQALVLLVKNRGLVILTACGHAGVINTIKYANKVTGAQNVYAILGGFHLSGKTYESLIDITINELEIVKPRFIIPCHCMGWKAVNQLIQLMPERFIQSSVGSTFAF